MKQINLDEHELLLTEAMDVLGVDLYWYVAQRLRGMTYYQAIKELFSLGLKWRQADAMAIEYIGRKEK